VARKRLKWATHLPPRARCVSRVKGKGRHQLRTDLVPPQRQLSAPQHPIFSETGRFRADPGVEATMV